MYVVRLKSREGRVTRRVVFPDVRDALRHMDAFVRSFPDLASEVKGSTGVLFRHDPASPQPEQTAAAS